MASTIKKELILVNPRVSYLFISAIQKTVTGNPVPYSLLTLAALTPKEYKIRLINQKSFWTHRDFPEGAIVGITCLTSAVYEAYRLADRFRRAGSKVVLGGPHVSALPDEALEHADSVVIGEAESVWDKVISDYEKGLPRKIYKGEALQDFFSPAYDYFLHLDQRLLSRSGVHIDRGCKYHCDFCARISSWLRFIKIEQVLELIKMIKKGKLKFFRRKPLVIFRSDNIYSSPAYAKELFRKLIPLEVNWGGNVSIDIGLDREALELAKASGCQGFLIGFETIHPKDYKKTSLGQLNSIADYRVAIKNIKLQGIRIIGSFILGLDSYGHLDYLKLLWFLMRVRLFSCILTILTPFPGSELYNRLKGENRILSFDWRKYNCFNCVIKPKRTSVASVYIWLFVIRFLSVFFSPYILLIWVACCVSWRMGYYFSRWLW